MVPPDDRQTIQVEVVYAKPERQSLLSLRVPSGATVKQAIEASGVLIQYPEIDLEQNPVGIFSKKASLGQILREFDRVEIYRPLIADPKQVRKQRADQGKVMRKGGSTSESLV